MKSLLLLLTVMALISTAPTQIGTSIGHHEDGPSTGQETGSPK